MERRPVVTVTEALQFYAPLLGLLALAFWSGVLSQRVKGLEARCAALESEESKQATLIERLVRLEVQMGHVEDGIGTLKRGVETMQRQLGNLMTGGGGKIIELPGQSS